MPGYWTCMEVPKTHIRSEPVPISSHSVVLPVQSSETGSVDHPCRLLCTSLFQITFLLGFELSDKPDER